MCRAPAVRGRAPAVLEEPDQQENDENQGDNAATDVHTSSSFGCCVNEEGVASVTASVEENDQLCARAPHLTLPGVGRPVEGIRLDREADLAARGMRDELRVGRSAILRRHDEVRIAVDLELLSADDAG